MEMDALQGDPYHDYHGHVDGHAEMDRCGVAAGVFPCMAASKAVGAVEARDSKKEVLKDTFLLRNQVHSVMATIPDPIKAAAMITSAALRRAPRTRCKSARSLVYKPRCSRSPPQSS